MCIVLLSTAHPDYPLILINNRDEFLHRPTSRAAFWKAPFSHILSGRDLARPECGTWLGVTRSGRIAVLTNFHESSSALVMGHRSRGVMTSSFLASDLSTRSFLHEVDSTGVGGFSMVCTALGKGRERELAVVSNRTAAGDSGVEANATWVPLSATAPHVLTNQLFTDAEPWHKVILGRSLLETAVTASREADEPEECLLERLFSILSHDTMPPSSETDTYDMEIDHMLQTIFVRPFVMVSEHPTTPPYTEPKVPADAPEASAVDAVHQGLQRENDCSAERHHDWPRLYGTQVQTVILVRRNGTLKYVERTLYDENMKLQDTSSRDVVFEFPISGWEQTKA